MRSGMSLLLVSPGRTWSCLRHQMSPSQNTAILILLRQKPNTSALSHKENLSAWAFEENVPSPDSVLKLKTHLRSAQERGLRGNSEDQAPHFPNMMKSPQQRCALINICLFNSVSCCVRAPGPGAAPEQAPLLLSSLCRIRNLKERRQKSPSAVAASFSRTLKVCYRGRSLSSVSALTHLSAP